MLGAAIGLGCVLGLVPHWLDAVVQAWPMLSGASLTQQMLWFQAGKGQLVPVLLGGFWSKKPLRLQAWRYWAAAFQSGPIQSIRVPDKLKRYSNVSASLLAYLMCPC